MLMYILGYRGVHWSMVDLPEAVLIKRIDFPSPSNHQWLMVHLPVVGAAEPLVLHAGMLTGLSLYRSCIDNQSCCKPMSAATLSYPRDAAVVPPNSGSCHLFTPSSMVFSESWWRGCVIEHHLCLSMPQEVVSVLQPIVCICVNCSYCIAQRSFSNEN